jgi:benzoyl-CoA reductase/2-hydroxyglutaryl-CoA dehydratase subunit BcrC/BadD/HgdB
MKKILCSSQYIPAGWISAHGLQPVMELSGSFCNSEGEGEGICTYAETLYRNALSENIDAVVFTTGCDQMRRISDLVRSAGKECFLMNIPSTWKNPVSIEIFKDELKRLSIFLSKQSEEEFSYEILKEELFKNKKRPEEIRKGKRISLMGGPMTGSDKGLIKLLVENGANIALDATEQGEIANPDIDFNNLEKDPVAEIANAYFYDMPDIAKRPNLQFYEKIEKLIEEREIEGIIVRVYPWCDLWHAEVQRIKEYFDTPVLQITADVNMEFEKDKRLQTRINAFLEMI